MYVSVCVLQVPGCELWTQHKWMWEQPLPEPRQLLWHLWQLHLPVHARVWWPELWTGEFQSCCDSQVFVRLKICAWKNWNIQIPNWKECMYCVPLIIKLYGAETPCIWQVWLAVVVAVVFWCCVVWLFQNLKECSSGPCRNGGVCKDSVGSYECLCATGFTGVNCEVNINECDTAVCPADSECVDGVGTYQCVCKVGYPGMLLLEYLSLRFLRKNCWLLYPVASDI